MTNSTVDVATIVRAPGDPGAVGCLLFGESTARFAIGNASAAVSCVGCTAICVISNLPDCMAEEDATAVSASNVSCLNVDGDGTIGDIFNCSSESTTVRSFKAEPPPSCSGTSCTYIECCDMFNASECMYALFALGTRVGGDWTADECPSGYHPIVDVTSCERAVENLTAAPNGSIVAMVVNDADHAPAGCLLYGHTQAVIAAHDVELATLCRGCRVVCLRNVPTDACLLV
eukprot:SAG31_NODE_428_length_15809_cov_9.783959_3_plen_231_part_00